MMHLDTFEALCYDIDIQIDNGVKSCILFPDWSYFVDRVEKTEYEVRDRLYSSIFIYRNYRFRVHQSWDSDDLLLSPPALNYGFKDFSCLRCGETNLLYDKVEDMFYCPLCE